MAKKVDSVEERLRRINLIKDYVLEQIEKGESFSTRSIAAYFTENEFSISNNTVNVYLNSLEKLDNSSYKKIKPYLENNKPKTIDDIKVKTRVLNALKLLLADYTIDQIASTLNSTNDTIYRDLTDRLPRIETNKEVLATVSSILKRHSMENLKHNTFRK